MQSVIMSANTYCDNKVNLFLIYDDAARYPPTLQVAGNDFGIQTVSSLALR